MLSAMASQRAYQQPMIVELMRDAIHRWAASIVDELLVSRH